MADAVSGAASGPMAGDDPRLAPPPPLSPDASPEEKDRHWFRHVYQGDRMPQLTLRAVLMGGVLGMLMSLSNLYTTVKLGWAFGVAITACVLSYVIWNALRALTGGKLRQMSILENTCMASTASAAGYSTGGTVGTAVGALLLISGNHMNWQVLVPFVLLSAGLGVFLAIPMKRQMINHEQLPFPSGIAAAETLRSLYTKGREAAQKATSLVAALLIGMLLAFLRSYEGLVHLLHEAKKAPLWLVDASKWLKVPEFMAFPSSWLVPRGTVATWGFEPSGLLVAAGMIVGLRVSLSMLGGSLLLFLFFIPYLHGLDASATGNAVTSFTYGPEGAFNPIRWSLWGGTSLMIFSSLTSLAVQWKALVRAFKIEKKAPGAESTAMDAIEVPFMWLVIGLVPIGLGLVILQHYAFQMSYLLGTIAVVMAFPVALVCCRATGETDTTPIGAMGKVTQLLYALLAKGNVTVNLMSAGVTSAAGGASADLLTDLKSGYLLGANPRKQFLAQFFGCFFGTLSVVPAWYLMFPNKDVLEEYNPPAANMWRAFAEALTKGLDSVPQTAQAAIVVGGLVGILLPLAGALFPKSRKYLPSAMGLGLAWVVPFANSLSFAIGAVLTEVWRRVHAKQCEKYNTPVASGLIAGEALLAAVIAIASTVVGILWLTPK
ncbi:MAG: OPT family oligopeptide transporter [Planctomycetota bacterium]|nr:OPT family oligopeptide transporter [Planctomycetota bacterium]